MPEPIPRLTVEQYQQLTALGILTDVDRIELIEGLIVQKRPQSPLYSSSVDRCRQRLTEAVPTGWYVRTHGSLVTADSVPEPSVVVVVGTPDDYDQQHPTGKDSPLVVEVGDAQLTLAREKVRIYAHAGVANYWIVNLIDRQMEVYSRAVQQEGTYAERKVLSSTDDAEFQLPTGEVIRLSVSQLLPKPVT